MAYKGKERRIHRIFVTRNTEYHVRRRTCVGVRDRRTGRWLRGHVAHLGKVAGGLMFNLRGGIVPNAGLPSIGESLFFSTQGRDLVTSPIISVERPTVEVVENYSG